LSSQVCNASPIIPKGPPPPPPVPEEETQAPSENETTQNSAANQSGPIEFCQDATPFLGTNPWTRSVPAADNIFPEPDCEEDWVVVEEEEEEKQEETILNGPLDFCPVPLGEFVVKSRTKMKNDRWEVL